MTDDVAFNTGQIKDRLPSPRKQKKRHTQHMEQLERTGDATYHVGEMIASVNDAVNRLADETARTNKILMLCVGLFERILNDREEQYQSRKRSRSKNE